jgi:hypothetical protein
MGQAISGASGCVVTLGQTRKARCGRAIVVPPACRGFSCRSRFFRHDSHPEEDGLFPACRPQKVGGGGTPRLLRKKEHGFGRAFYFSFYFIFEGLFFSKKHYTVGVEERSPKREEAAAWNRNRK